jgi:hypothetical protein
MPAIATSKFGLTEEEAAFDDALAGGSDDLKAEPDLAAIAHEIVESIRRDLTVDWTDRRATEAKMRTKIKRLLRRHRDKLPAPVPARSNGGGEPADRLNYLADMILDQARCSTDTGPRSRAGCSTSSDLWDGRQ